MLNRNVLIDGKVYNKHDVVLVTHNIGTFETIITVESSNQEDTIERSFAIALVDGMTFAQAEEQAWSMPLYQEYIDESAEALNSVLDILTDEQAEQFPQLYPEWAIGISYERGKRVRYDDKLYRCEQKHTSEEGWEPDKTPALWTRVAAEGEILDWVQPTGEHDAYNAGDKVRYEGKVWVSTYDGKNVWEPGVYGWDEVTDE